MKALIFALLAVGNADAITVNPASAVTADSEATAFTIPYRDASGNFAAGISAVGSNDITVSSAATSAFSLVLDGAYTTPQIQAKTPSAVGQLVYNTTLNNLCISTGAATAQAYKLVGTASTTCQ